jgi:transcriptional regulator with XRE-family HTH domain
MSQEHLAQQLGVTFQQIQKYEAGKNRMSAARLYEICQVFGVPIASMLEDIPRSAPAPKKTAPQPRVQKKKPPRRSAASCQALRLRLCRAPRRAAALRCLRVRHRLFLRVHLVPVLGNLTCPERARGRSQRNHG